MKTRHGIQFLFVLAMVAAFLWVKPAAIQAETRAGTIFVNDDVSDGLAAHWKFDETGATTALDFAGANHATLVDTASLSNASLPALAMPNTGSLALDGNTVNPDYAQIDAPTAALALSISFTMTGWVRRTTTGTYDTIYNSGAQANKWWIFIADGSAGKDNKLGFGKRGISEDYSTQSIIDTNWHHIAVVKNGNAGNNLSFYVDGAPAGTAAVGSVSIPSGSARIGALLDGSVSAQFGGNIDDLRVYNRALSAAEVTRLAQGQGCVTDGASWATAFRELQCALAAASSGEEIWLAGGTYRPSTGREVSFFLVDGVNLLGGFTGNETLASQRPAFDPTAVLTNLSGDILGDDNPSGFTNYAENSLQVVIAGAGVSATLDGLAIRQGNNDAASGTGAGLEVQAGAVGLTLNNVVVSGNSAAGSGGGIHSQAPLTLSQVTVTGNRGQSGGGINTTAPLTINGGLFDGNRAVTFFGGGIDASSHLTVNGVTFDNNQAPFGGGAIESAGLSSIITTITDSTFTNNRVTSFTGGALEVPVTNATIAGSTFSGNTAPQDGGAIFAGSGSLTVNASTFTNNQASGSNCFPICSNGSGGAISAGGTLIVTGTTFSNNTARLDGGAIVAKGPAATLANSTLNTNHAGFPADTGNPGLGRGGAIFSSGTLTLDDTNFGGNGAQISGGGVFVDTAGTAAINGGTFTANIATTTDGGGLFTAGGVSNLTGVTFTGNTAGRFGGGARLNAADIQFSDFIANSAASEGGGALLLRASEVIASTFTGNSSDLSGGLSMQGTSDRSQTLRVINSLFYNNFCISTAGVADMRLFDLTIDLVNNTFARPAVAGQRSVAFFRSNLDAENNIWNGYLTSLLEGQTATGITISEDYNLFFNAPLGATIPPGAHNLTADPQFVDPIAADFSLRSSSPGIDSGDNSALPAGILTDWADQPRFVDSPGAPNTGVGTPPVDRGAFEYSLKALYLPVIVR